MKACTASLNFEIFASSASADDESTTSQPVSSVSAPRLAPPVMKRRRVRSGITFRESLMRRRLSTPGMRWERLAMMMSSKIRSAADDHRAQALWHQHRERDMDDQ